MVLPEVLVGLNDTRGEMVTATLHTLAELVPLLGPEAVIGTTRRQVFIDSQPRVSVCMCVCVRERKRERERERERPQCIFIVHLTCMFVNVCCLYRRIHCQLWQTKLVYPVRVM